MQKAKQQFFSDVDIEYGKKYGIMPDYHYTQLWEKGVHPDVIRYLINTRMRLIWNRMKYEHEHAEEIAKQKELERQQKEMEQLDKENPFIK